jgi:hypothetical protein
MKQLKFILFLGLLLQTISLFGQEENTLTKSQQKEIINKLASNLEEAYVFEDKAIEMSKALKKAKFSKDIEVFLKEVNVLLANLANDAHLQFLYDPSLFQELINPIKSKTEEVDNENGLRVKNYGFKEVKILNGNIGYLKISGFYENEEAFKVAAAAMEFLKHSDAYIIDLRENPGGSGKMGQFLASYFFEQSDEKMLLTNYNRKNDELTQEWNLFDIPGERRSDKPLYIIINKHTGSAAEALPYAMQAYKKATIVGKPSFGGAHSGDDEALAHGFIAFIPSGRVLSPVTNDNWEQKGVQPDINIDPKLAVYKIQSLLIDKWLTNDSLSHNKQTYLGWYSKYYKALLNSEKVTPSVTLTGNYKGYKVSIKDGKLYFGSKELIPFSESIFFAKTGYRNSNNGDLIFEFDNVEQPNKLFYTIIRPSGEVEKISLNKE